MKSGSQRVFVLESVAVVIALPYGDGLFYLLCSFCVGLRSDFIVMSAGDRETLLTGEFLKAYLF